MNSPKPKADESVVERFERLDDEVPLSEMEAKAILDEAGIDPHASLKKLFSKLDQIAAQEREQRFAKAEIAHRKELGALARREAANDRKGRPELLAQVHLYRQQHPTLSAQFRNFESMNDDDLRSLLAEVEELISREEEG